MHLELQKELTEPKFADVGRPYHIFRDDGKHFVVICSAFSTLGWSGRCYYEGQIMLHRVSLYLAGSYELLGLFDCKFPVQDLSFHPTESQLAVATGSYDGGWVFEGELILWKWEENISYPLLRESREAVRCRFNDNGSLAVLLRPRNEEECRDAFDRFLGLVLHELSPVEPLPANVWERDPRLLDLDFVEPQVFGFEDAHERPQEISESDRAELLRNGFEERHAIWDIEWTGESDFITCHNCCQAEIWSTRLGRLQKLTGAGHGIELLHHPLQGSMVNVRAYHGRGWSDERSSLYRIQEGELTLVKAFDHAFTLSMNDAGFILAIDTHRPISHASPKRDKILGLHGTILWEGDLGEYDCFNHPLRLKRGADLYFIAGNVSTGDWRMTLRKMTPEGHMTSSCDWSSGNTLFHGQVVSLLDSQTIVRAGQITVKETRITASEIASISLHDGRCHWSTPLPSRSNFTALAAAPEMGCAIFARTDGEWGLVDTATGEITYHTSDDEYEFPSVVTALAVQGDHVLVGTLDGRLLLYRVCKS